MQNFVSLPEGRRCEDVEMPTGRPRIHPTAIISPEAELADDVTVGPYAFIDDKIRIGPGCVIGPYVQLSGTVTLGARNQLFAGVVIGERPQHLKYNDEPTCVEIGDGNVFREHVTIHRGTTHSWATRIGNGNFLMAHSHVAHDCRVGNNCILANGALMGGHCSLQDNVYISGNSALHQFVNMGRLALLSGTSASTKDVPPFIVIQGINIVCGLNLVGLRRAGMSHEQIDGLKQAFHIIYRDKNLLSRSLDQVEHELGAIDVVHEMITFIRQSKRGISLGGDINRAA